MTRRKAILSGSPARRVGGVTKPGLASEPASLRLIPDLLPACYMLQSLLIILVLKLTCERALKFTYQREEINSEIFFQKLQKMVWVMIVSLFSKHINIVHVNYNTYQYILTHINTF